ncbi:MAG: glutamine--fructose-6-phosphate transaminase (isomerizing), partial [Planctomycetaceae bacterium]
MCGIIAYLGSEIAGPLLLDGLRRLEYRGYDSAGLATLTIASRSNTQEPPDWRISTRKAVGPVDCLAERLAAEPVPGSVGIAHTRWATHGAPTLANAHPHLDATGRIALVHNGIIENAAAVRAYLEGEGVQFASETDSECLAQLIGFLFDRTRDLNESVRRALREVRGTFGLALLCAEAPSTLIAARRGSPLVLGIGPETAEGRAYLIASDVAAILPHTSQVAWLDDDEIVTVSPAGHRVTALHAGPVTKTVDTIEMTLEEIDRGDHAHYMLKEIHEQPESLRNALRGRLCPAEGRIVLGGLTALERELPRCKRVVLFGCGTAWHAALIGKYLFEHLAGIPTNVEYASELRYRNPIIEEGTLAIAISQSGETADTLAALREVRTKGATVLGLVNAVGSSIARETDAGVYLHAGPEIGVASTKAFTAQVAVLTMMATDLGRRRLLPPANAAHITQALSEVPETVARALELEPRVERLAVRLADRENWLYLGRGINFPVALEGALKLKEVSYIHAEGLPAAEMKHGPIAMIDRGMPVVVIAVRDHTYEKILSNIEEVRSRGGRVIAIASAGDTEIGRLADEVLCVPAVLPILSPLVASVPLQLLAYHT